MEPSRGTMKILLTADQYYPPTLGGSAIATRRLAHGLAERGHLVYVLAPAMQFRHSLERDGKTVVIRCRSIPALHLRRYVNRHQIRVALVPDGVVERTIKRLQPDIIHIQLPAYIGAIAARIGKKMGIPMVATNHAMPENMLPVQDKNNLAFKMVGKRFWDETIKMCESVDCVIAPSMTACDMLLKNGLERQAIPISNGVDLQVFHPAASEEERMALRTRFKLPHDRTLILYAGRLAVEKRLDVLVDSLPKVFEKTNAHMVFTGTGSTEISERVQALGIQDRVSFTGMLDDQLFPLIYRAVDLFAIPSEAELQGIVLLEAAASGLPLVGANAQAIPEIVKHGQNGFLFAPGQVDELAERLTELVASPELRRSMGDTSLQFIKNHAIEECVAQNESVYHSVLNQRALSTDT